MSRNPDWTREELIVAFNLYCTLTFTRINASNKEVKELADIIGRSNNAVAIKLANFARLDPALQARNVAGMSHGGHGEELVWDEFNSDWDKLAFESELLKANFQGVRIEESAQIETDDLPKIGKEREALIKVRVNQSFFRKSILASYNQSCCITGIVVPELLIASHIIPWAKNEKERMNPQNGLCLNGLHDRAFDKGLITITPDFKIKISELLKSQLKPTQEKFFIPFDNQTITLPGRFLPQRDFLEYHAMNIFIK